MEFLNTIAAPQSLEHFRLIVMIAAISSLIFIPYAGFVLGSSIVSYWYDRKAQKEQNPVFLLVAHRCVDNALYNKSLITFLAIIPGLSIVFSYAQMLQGTTAIAVSAAAAGFIFLLAGFVLLYSYKYTFRVQEILESYQKILARDTTGTVGTKEMDSYDEANTLAHRRSGRWGLVFLSVSIILYIAALDCIVHPAQWNTMASIPDSFLSVGVWLKIVQFCALAAGLTGTGILYFTFSGEPDESNGSEYAGIVKRLGVRLSVISLLALPIVLLISLASLSNEAISGYSYGLAGITVLLLFTSAHFLYSFVKTSYRGVLVYGWLSFVLAAIVLVVNDHIAIGTATHSQSVVVASRHEKEMEDLKSKLGVVTVKVTGREIYDTRCASCHLFNARKVGPPYDETIPKYNGNKPELIAFILSPGKKNPEYPPMPNPGLKPAEADSIASFLIRSVAAHTVKRDANAPKKVK
jgi:cytochrome c